MARQSFKPSSRDRAHMQQLPDSVSDLPERVLVDLDGKDADAFEIIEVDDDIDEADRGQPRELDRSIAEQEEDLRDLSARAQKRINRLKYETNTERRAREAAERERDAAIISARAMNEEITRLRAAAQSGSTALANSMKAQRETMLADAERRLAAAHADGDSDAIAKATRDMSMASAELSNIAARAPAPAEERRVEPPAQQAPPRSNMHPNAQAWIDRNTWFQRPGYEDRTAKAMSLHYELEARGIKPASPNYATELDKGMKAVYSDHQAPGPAPDGDVQEGRSTPRRTNAVAEGSRETRVSSSPRTVELTQSELSIAKRLGVTPQAYAAQKLRSQQNTRNGAQ